MKNIFKKKLLLISLISLSLFLFVNIEPASAQFWENLLTGASNTLGTIISLILGTAALLLTTVTGLLITLVIKILVNVANFSNIINVDAVTTGWVIVRDLCNMFFILILLAIAFGTILRLESYSIKRLLPKLIIMAVLINFSKMIFGLIIDFGQVVMLTFTNSFANNHGWFIDIFNVQDLFSLRSILDSVSSDNPLQAWSIAAAVIAGAAASIITLIVITVMLMVLVMRVIMLWLYTILSPLVFLGFAFPALQRYTSRIWEDFIKQVIVGPMLAFFIWLALSTADRSSEQLTENGEALNIGGDQLCAGVSQFFCEGNFQTYLITIGLLMGGLMVTQQIGGAAGSAAGRGMNWVRGSGRIGKKIGKAGLFKAGRGLDTWQSKKQASVAKRMGLADYRPKSLNYKAIAGGWKMKKEADLKDYYSQVARPDTWAQNFDKHLKLGQYGAWRKPRAKIQEDEKTAKLLDVDSSVVQSRINTAKLNTKAKKDKLDDLSQNEEKVKQSYVKQSLEANPDWTKKQREDWAEEEYQKDWESLSWTGAELKAAEDKRDKIDSEATDLRDHVKAKFIPYADRGRFQPSLTPRFGKNADEEACDVEQSKMSKETQGKDFAVINEFLNGVREESSTKVTAALRILAQNNDTNELMKDQRVIRLLTQQNGLLEKMNANGHFGEVLGNTELTNMKDDLRANPASPAYLQALVQGAYDKIGVDKSTAARHAHNIGGLSIAGGNGIGYGMSFGNSATGNYEFSKLKVKGNRLETADDRNGALSGKMANYEPQTKMRNLHPDTIFSEDASGAAAHLHDMGREFLSSLTGQDVEQVNRLRLDNITKIGKSKQVQREIMQFAKDLEDKNQTAQAELVKIFLGHVVSKFKGKGLKPDLEKNAKDAYKDLENEFKI